MFHQKDYPLIFIHERINRNKLRSCFSNLIINSHQYNENAIIRKEFRYRVEIDALEDFTPIDLD